jgi:hypothetical protein
MDDGTQLGFHIERPHCIPNYPYLMTEVPEAMNQGAIVYAKMMVDKKKPKKAKLDLEFVMDSPKGERIGWFALKDFPIFFQCFNSGCEVSTYRWDKESNICIRRFKRFYLSSSTNL